jgi:predicted transport protein
MSIFRIDQKKLTPISEKKINLERDIQKLTEQNLEAVFGLKFICSEFQLNNLRIDTLSYDKESRSFVIIEFKKDKNYSVIDQGYAYLGLMLNNKADFILEYNEKVNGNLKRNDVDWSQSRVLFVSSQFTTYQQRALHFSGMPIELWEAKSFNNETVLYNQIKSPESSESIKTITKNKSIEKINKEVAKYSIEDHLRGKPKDISDLFDNFRQRINELGDNVTEFATKYYIAFRNPRINFVTFHIFHSKLHMDLIIDDATIDDPRKVLTKFPPAYGYAKNLKRFDFHNGDDLNYAMNLISQAYNFNNGRWE